jgi:hypothetical protein
MSIPPFLLTPCCTLMNRRHIIQGGSMHEFLKGRFEGFDADDIISVDVVRVLVVVIVVVGVFRVGSGWLVEFSSRSNNTTRIVGTTPCQCYFIIRFDGNLLSTRFDSIGLSPVDIIVGSSTRRNKRSIHGDPNLFDNHSSNGNRTRLVRTNIMNPTTKRKYINT